MMKLKNRIVVVTGSTRGFGLATARAFVEAGATVVVTGRSRLLTAPLLRTGALAA